MLSSMHKLKSCLFGFKQVYCWRTKFSVWVFTTIKVYFVFVLVARDVSLSESVEFIAMCGLNLAVN